MLVMNKKLHHWLDNMGFSLSMLCAIHCLFFPILFIVLPLLGMSIFLNATAEKFFVIGSVAMAAFSLFWGFRIHKNKTALFVYLAGAIMLLTATFFMKHNHAHSDHHEETEHVGALEEHEESHPQNNPYSLVLLVLGGVGIASSHLLNKKLCKSCHAHQH